MIHLYRDIQKTGTSKASSCMHVMHWFSSHFVGVPDGRCLELIQMRSQLLVVRSLLTEVPRHCLLWQASNHRSINTKQTYFLSIFGGSCRWGTALILAAMLGLLRWLSRHAVCEDLAKAMMFVGTDSVVVLFQSLSCRSHLMKQIAFAALHLFSLSDTAISWVIHIILHKIQGIVNPLKPWLVMN